jgi:phosphohistidine phosphatase
MRVILFRHGPAGSRDPARWPDDSERPLTARGLEKTRDAARGLARMENTITRVWSSPLRRAVQTAKALEEAVSGAKVEMLEPLAPGASNRAVLAKLAEGATDQTVVLVGHEPGLGKLATLLVVGSGAAIELSLKKAGACAVDFEGAPQAGKGELIWLLPPKPLRKLGRKGKAARTGKARA